VVVGDFNGDGKLDVAVLNYEWGTAFILLGDGTGNFSLASSTGTGTASFSIALGDFNGDGKLDLAVANVGGNAAILLQVPPVLAVSLFPTRLTFRTQLVGTSSSPQHVTLSNTGNAMLDITKIAVSANFSQTNNCPSKVLPGGGCTIYVTFSPHTRDRHTGTVTLTDSAPNSPQKVRLTGAGTVVTLLPSSLDFGDQQVGTTSPPQMATLTNYGKEAVLIHSIQINGRRGESSYAQTNNCGTNVAAGGSCTISVTFTPKFRGQKTAKLTVKDNGGGGPQTVGLSGKGT
jgi:hypothetical protein